MGDILDTASVSVITRETGHLCDWCNDPIPPPKRKPRADQPRRFCRASHRAAWHAAQKRKKAQEILALAEGIVSRSRELS